MVPFSFRAHHFIKTITRNLKEKSSISPRALIKISKRPLLPLVMSSLWLYDIPAVAKTTNETRIKFLHIEKETVLADEMLIGHQSWFYYQHFRDFQIYWGFSIFRWKWFVGYSTKRVRNKLLKLVSPSHDKKVLTNFSASLCWWNNSNFSKNYAVICVKCVFAVIKQSKMILSLKMTKKQQHLDRKGKTNDTTDGKVKSVLNVLRYNDKITEHHYSHSVMINCFFFEI